MVSVSKAINPLRICMLNSNLRELSNVYTVHIYIYKVVAFVCVCVYNSRTAHTTGLIMTKPGMMMVPHLGMVHTIFQGQGQMSRS